MSKFPMINVVIITGDELRHEFVRKTIADDPEINVLATFCEGTEFSLSNRVNANRESSELQHYHVIAREQAERDFFLGTVNNIRDNSHPIKIKKGDINTSPVFEKIDSLAPDLLICYGSSIVKGELLTLFSGRFINVHLGLSPHYRGSGTNVWPLINNEPEYVGATFMHIDEGIDTGKVIHQIRARVFLGDSPHAIGNRLIRDMCTSYRSIIKNFRELQPVEQISVETGKLYLRKDFTNEACEKMYHNFSEGMIEKYLKDINQRKMDSPLMSNALISDSYS
jgi:folate-dependent phosphoribosylglycinamide formyltransferase PurN